MPRVKSGVTAHARHKKILKLAKGYRGTRSRLFKKANETVMKALFYARRDRRAKKREFRKLWIARINAATRMNGLTYSRVRNGNCLTSSFKEISSGIQKLLSIVRYIWFAQSYLIRFHSRRFVVLPPIMACVPRSPCSLNMSFLSIVSPLLR